MNITVIDQQHCKKQLRLEIPSEAVRPEIDKIAAQMSRRVRVDGFRPGRVPKSVILTRFKKELRDEVASQILPKSFEEAVQEKGLTIVGRPSLDEFAFTEDESINASFTLDVAPDFQLADYAKLPVQKRVYKVTEQNLKSAIDHMREGQAELVPVEDRASENGDTVSVSISGELAPYVDSAPVPAGKSLDGILKTRDLDLELGGNRVIKEFTEALTGVRTGDSKTFEVEYPADYDNQLMAGRRIAYSAEVTAVRKRVVPELDDEFVTGLEGGYKTVDDLRAAVSVQLEEQARSRSEHEVREEVKKRLLDLNLFEVPEVLVHKQAESMVKSFARQLASQRVDPRALNLDWDALYERQREPAADAVRAEFVLRRIADAENIEATEAEMDAEIQRIASLTGKTAAVVRATLTKEESLDSIKEQIENRKALEFVVASADIKTEEIEGMDGAGAGAEHAESESENPVE